LTGKLIEADIVAVGIGHGDGMECCHYFSSVVRALLEIRP
jgi:hypothetical protein